MPIVVSGQVRKDSTTVESTSPFPSATLYPATTIYPGA